MYGSVEQALGTSLKTAAKEARSSVAQEQSFLLSSFTTSFLRCSFRREGSVEVQIFLTSLPVARTALHTTAK